MVTCIVTKVNVSKTRLRAKNVSATPTAAARYVNGTGELGLADGAPGLGTSALM